MERLTMLEMANRMDPNGDAAKIINVLVKTKPMLNLFPMLEANNVFSYDITRVLSMGTTSRRRINKGVPNTSAETTKVTEGMTLYERRAESDVELVDASPNPAVTRNDEAMIQLEGMAQDIESDIFYASRTMGQEYFDGLAVRMDSLQSHRVISCGGSGSDLSSIYIIQPGERKVACFYPRGSKTVGLMREDLGIGDAFDADGNRFRAYMDRYLAKLGLAVFNDRCIARVCNIETTGTTNTLNDDAIIEALNHLPMAGDGAVLLMNNTIWTQLAIIAKDKVNVNYSAGEPFGRPLRTFQGHRIEIAEMILNTETALT